MIISNGAQQVGNHVTPLMNSHIQNVHRTQHKVAETTVQQLKGPTSLIHKLSTSANGIVFQNMQVVVLS